MTITTPRPMRIQVPRRAEWIEVDCPECNGEGEVEHFLAPRGTAHWRTDETMMACCPTCEGRGRIITDNEEDEG